MASSSVWQPRKRYHPTGVRGKRKLSPTDVAFLTRRFEAKLR